MANYNRPSPYAKIANFGKLNPVLKTDPVAASIYKDLGSFFDIGSNAGDFGPASERSQLYMSERCSKNWDGACELMSQTNDIAKCSNIGGICSVLFSRSAPSTLTVGDVLVDNTAVRAFCDMSSCSITKESFNPLESDSPMVTKYGDCNYKQCQPVCMPPSDPDNDIVLNKVLDYPEKHIDLLVNMYKNVMKKGERDSYKNTRIGFIFEILDDYVKRNPAGL